VSGTAAVDSRNFITANNVALTMPAAADGKDLWVYVTAARTGLTLVPGSGQTVDNGSGPQTIDVTPIALNLVYDAVNTNWFICGVKT
jgi:hypothetical protein